MENVDKIKRGEPVRDPDKIVSATLSISCSFSRTAGEGVSIVGSDEQAVGGSPTRLHVRIRTFVAVRPRFAGHLSRKR